MCHIRGKHGQRDDGGGYSSALARTNASLIAPDLPSQSRRTWTVPVVQPLVTAARIRQLEPTVQAELSRPVSFAVHQWNAQAKSSSQIIQSKLLVYFMVILLLTTIIAYRAWVVQRRETSDTARERGDCTLPRTITKAPPTTTFSLCEWVR
ncbi:MAG: hypothetical protein K6T83_09530 [Alicyclobacillus sp.]|nr:hypothetical protein [Alicyclobacillus sp.]